MKYIKKFGNSSEYEVFLQGDGFVRPNVSYISEDSEVFYNKLIEPGVLVVRYLVEDEDEDSQGGGGATRSVTGGTPEPDITTGVPLYLYMDSTPVPIHGVDIFDRVVIDGVEVPVSELDANQGRYDLDVGEHVVEYKLKDPTRIGLFGSPSEPETMMARATFQNCPITSVSIPDSVTTIGDYTFCGCRLLTGVTFGNGVESIGHMAFNGCTRLASVAFPDNVTTIGTEAFYGCGTLTSVSLGSGVAEIWGLAFAECPLDAESRAAITAINPEAIEIK